MVKHGRAATIGRDGQLSRLRETGARVFGWQRLRPGQERAMLAVLAGRDTLVVMPTGAGKSACYQLPAVLLDGPTVVVSPLIALQKDQAGALNGRSGALGRHGEPAAVAVNSTIGERARRAAFERVEAGEAEYLFLSPEQLARDDVVEEVAAAQPALFVVDEAHCVSSWGHDFRPDYLRLGEVIERLGHPTVLALTATAAPPVRADIVDRLSLREPEQVITGFDRPNIWIGVQRFTDADSQRRAVLDRASAAARPAIVYVPTRRDSESYAAELAGRGFRAAAYHAGLRGAERDAVQASFMAGELDLVVATTAFGMGIDKADVRFVLHTAVADSLDSYYQEIGRSGRDGDPAEAVLLYRPEDLQLRRFQAAGGKPRQDDLTAVAAAVADAEAPIGLAQLRAETAAPPRRVTQAVNLLREAGAVKIDERGEVTPAANHDPDHADEPNHADDPALAALRAEGVSESHERLERSRIEMMRGYAETTGCRWQYLLGYFGEILEEPCGHCDNCAAGRSRRQPGRSVPFPVDSRVRHNEWGEGTVLRYEDDRVVVLFEQVGYKTLDLGLVRRRRLLAPT
jgi:ATP-dependent DNA helicase RecQ